MTGSTPPPLVILASQSPYSTDATSGAIDFALACAHEGISTRVVFIEEGVYTVTGSHGHNGGRQLLNLQETVEMTSKSGMIEYYVLIPSQKLRGVGAAGSSCGVFPINAAKLARLITQPPPASDSGMQRIFLF